MELKRKQILQEICKQMLCLKNFYQTIKNILEPHIWRINTLVCLNIRKKNMMEYDFNFSLKHTYPKWKIHHTCCRKKSPPTRNRISSGIIKIFVVLFSSKNPYLDSCLSCEKSSAKNFAFSQILCTVFV